MLSRAVLPLTRPNVLASAVRASALSARSSPYAAYKLSPGIQQRAKSSKAKKTPQAPAPENKEFAAEQPEFDTKAEPKAAESSGTVR
jgi:import inner membrane translocase subunit TIM50